ncbi:hypothetical protein BDW59DRAFT_171856 [Aspergillus cavernicola]|uniref:Enoyl reductase (ER) domain-containing protein n=1 Tax=Aspergillus cavernicola TaxID=176166 RepID=A0ABR4IFD8_9EURO
MAEQTPTPKFQGWLSHTPASAEGNMIWGSFEPKLWEADDIDIRITHCGGETPYPCCVGHEIIGHAVRVGENVKKIHVGDRVGVGPQARSCLKAECAECSSGREVYCAAQVGTYGCVYPDGKGKSYGGYGDYNRTHQRFVVRIPYGLASEDAAPMLCAGITVFWPLKRYGCGGGGKKIGVVGVGGLGHFAVLFAKAMGAEEVVGISRSASKKQEVLELGATRYIASSDEGWAEENARSLDLVICTVSGSRMPLDDYLKLLKVGGTFVQVGAPDNGDLPRVNAFALIFNNVNLAGSAAGSPHEIEEMLQFAVDHNVKARVQVRPLSEANQVIKDMEAGKARYRYVLENTKHL